MNTGVQTGLRMTPETVQAWLDRLDRDAGPPRGLDVRLSPRFAYRSRGLMLELSETGSPATRHEAAGRNLSREGLGVLASRFVYPRTPCRVTLLDRQAQPQTVSGEVVRCRYVVGSGSLYDVGISLHRSLDVATFTAEE